jgi:hypothetical protein
MLSLEVEAVGEIDGEEVVVVGVEDDGVVVAAVLEVAVAVVVEEEGVEVVVEKVEEEVEEEVEPVEEGVVVVLVDLVATEDDAALEFDVADAVAEALPLETVEEIDFDEEDPAEEEEALDDEVSDAFFAQYLISIAAYVTAQTSPMSATKITPILDHLWIALRSGFVGVSSHSGSTCPESSPSSVPTPARLVDRCRRVAAADSPRSASGIFSSTVIGVGFS